jgi:uncharacterized protein YlzI (FlbEa/FlbD family)
MTTKITLVNGESIVLDLGAREVVAEINMASGTGSLMSTKGRDGREVWVNPTQVMKVETMAAVHQSGLFGAAV